MGNVVSCPMSDFVFIYGQIVKKNQYISAMNAHVAKGIIKRLGNTEASLPMELNFDR